MVRASALLILGSLASFAHGIWIVGPTSAAKGETVKVEIRHGHQFPNGEEILNPSGVRLYVVEGEEPRELTLRKTASCLEAEFQARGGRLRYYAIQDRGILSRTAAGLKPGGRDQNPDATETFRAVRVILSSNPDSAKPIDLSVKLQGGEAEIRTRKDGAPIAGANIAVYLPGKEETGIGASGPAGTLRYALPPGYKGPVLFAAEYRHKHAGGAYDEDRLAAFVSLQVR